MKRIWLFIVWLCALFYIWNFTQAKDYEYTNLDITANILNDGTINVNENFTANFFVSKHWIIRDIPLNYSVEWKDFHIEVSNINVQWKNFTTSKNNWNIEIKIWDANRTVIWEQNYPISYSTYGLIRNFSWMWYAELYWNLVGYDFDTNINRIKAELILPKTYTWFTKDDFLITTDWTAKTIDRFAWTVDRSQWDRIIITYDKWLSAYHWITLAIKFPNNYFEFDHEKQAGLVGHSTYFNVKKVKVLLFFWIFWLIMLISFYACILTIIKILRYLFKKWKISFNEKRIRKAYEKKYPIIIQYDLPKWLTSAEVWLILHRKAKTQDLLTLIYKWAFDKYIKISDWDKHSESEFLLIKLKDLPLEYPKYERKLFDAIFSEDIFKITKGENVLYYKLKSAANNLESFWWKMWRFFKNDYQNSSIWCKDFLYFFIALPMLAIPIFPIIFIILVGLYIFIEVWDFLETEKWAKLISHILWYKKFIKSCDENKFRVLLKEDPMFFDKVLPYAIVFGLDSELINKILPIMQEMNNDEVEVVEEEVGKKSDLFLQLYLHFFWICLYYKVM